MLCEIGGCWVGEGRGGRYKTGKAAKWNRHRMMEYLCSLWRWSFLWSIYKLAWNMFSLHWDVILGGCKLYDLVYVSEVMFQWLNLQPIQSKSFPSLGFYMSASSCSACFLWKLRFQGVAIVKNLLLYSAWRYWFGRKIFLSNFWSPVKDGTGTRWFQKADVMFSHAKYKWGIVEYLPGCTL